MVAADMGGGAENRQAGAGGGQHGLTRDPRLLAAAAAGLGSAVIALWAMRGLPLGGVLLWVSPLPLFLAGLGFGTAALGIGTAIAALALLLLGSTVSLGIWLVSTGLPVAALLLAASRGAGRADPGRLDLGWSLAMLGLYPAAVILVAALVLADVPGGLEGAMRHVLEVGLARMGMQVSGGVVAEVARVKAAAIGFWLSIALVANAAAARSLLARLGLPAPAMPLAAARLPRIYPALPAAAGLFWMAAPEGGDAVQLSVLLVLMLPVFLQGLGALHIRSRPLRGRPVMLVLLYALLILFSVPTALMVTALGFLEHWGRRAPALPPQS